MWLKGKGKEKRRERNRMEKGNRMKRWYRESGIKRYWKEGQNATYKSMRDELLNYKGERLIVRKIYNKEEGEKEVEIKGKSLKIKIGKYEKEWKNAKGWNWTQRVYYNKERKEIYIVQIRVGPEVGWWEYEEYKEWWSGEGEYSNEKLWKEEEKIKIKEESEERRWERGELPSKKYIEYRIKRKKAMKSSKGQRRITEEEKEEIEKIEKKLGEGEGEEEGWEWIAKEEIKEWERKKEYKKGKEKREKQKEEKKREEIERRGETDMDKWIREVYSKTKECKMHEEREKKEIEEKRRNEELEKEEMEIEVEYKEIERTKRKIEYEVELKDIKNTYKKEEINFEKEGRNKIKHTEGYVGEYIYFGKRPIKKIKVKGLLEKVEKVGEDIKDYKIMINHGFKSESENGYVNITLYKRPEVL